MTKKKIIAGGNKLCFYVFYDKNDFVKYCGTARDLVNRGFYKSVRDVKVIAHRKNKRKPNSVLKILMTKDEITECDFKCPIN